MVRQLKEAITKDELWPYLSERDQVYLNKVDKIRDGDLSIGKWNKLYALIAEVRKVTGRNLFIYESPNLLDYDTSCHRVYPHIFTEGRTQLWQSILSDPHVKEK